MVTYGICTEMYIDFSYYKLLPKSSPLLLQVSITMTESGNWIRDVMVGGEGGLEFSVLETCLGAVCLL